MIWQPEFTDKTLSRKPGAVQFYERTVQNCGYETVVSVSAGTGRGYRPAEREYPATITPVVAVIQDGVSVAC